MKKIILGLVFVFGVIFIGCADDPVEFSSGFDNDMNETLIMTATQDIKITSIKGNWGKCSLWATGRYFGAKSFNLTPGDQVVFRKSCEELKRVDIKSDKGDLVFDGIDLW